jgi:hypothetical protein
MRAWHVLAMTVRSIHQLHDARLVGINYLPNASIRLDFEQVDGQKVAVLLNQVLYFFCTGMLEGNIVQSVEILADADVTDRELAYFVEREGRGQSAETLGRAIKAKQLSMLLLSPSYGAELGCVCAGVEQN